MAGSHAEDVGDCLRLASAGIALHDRVPARVGGGNHPDLGGVGAQNLVDFLEVAKSLAQVLAGSELAGPGLDLVNYHTLEEVVPSKP